MAPSRTDAGGGGLKNPAARAWLEALGLEPRLPDTRFLEDLFHVFQRRVAYETLTRPAGDAGRLDVEAFAAEWAEEERGLTGEERARAFAWLAGELGFDVVLEESTCSRPWAKRGGDEPEAHRSVVAHVEGRRILADAGFPLPALVPLRLPSEEIPSSFGTLNLEQGEGEGDRIRVTCDARAEVSELLRVGGGAAARRAPPRAAAPFATRVLDDRVLHWEGGVMTVLDAWSVLRYPVAGTERAAFESLFALNLEGVDLPGVPAADLAPALTVFHTVPLPPEDVRRDLARVDPPPSTLVAPPEAFVEAVPGGSRVARRAAFLAAVPSGGPGESVRKTLVFHLAMDLLRLGAGPGG